MCSGGGVDELDVLDLLAVLVARSLVVADDAPSGERRYRLLETVRQYAEERLDEDERHELHERHARHYADFVERATNGLRGPDQLQWQLHANAELENLRAALAWVVSHDEGVQAERFLCVVGRVPSALSRVMLRDAESILALPSIQSIERYPSALAAAACRACSTARSSAAEQLCQQALDAAGEPSDELLALILLTRGNIAYGTRRPAPRDRVTWNRRRTPTGGPATRSCWPSACVPSRSGGASRATSRSPRGRGTRPSRSRARPAIRAPSAQALGALAMGLAPTEPEQSRSFIAESLALNDALGGAVVDENALSMVLMASAVLGERDAALDAVRSRAPTWALAPRRRVRMSRGDRGRLSPWTRPRSQSCSTGPSTRSFLASRRPNRTRPSDTVRTRPSSPISTRRGSPSCARQGAAMTEDEVDRLRARSDRACDLIARIRPRVGLQRVGEHGDHAPVALPHRRRPAQHARRARA